MTVSSSLFNLASWPLCGIVVGTINLAANPTAASDRTEPATEFARWSTQIAAQHNGFVRWTDELELDGDPGAERVTMVCTAPHSALFLVEDPKTGARWQLIHESWGRHALCPTGPTPEKTSVDRTGLTLSNTDILDTETRHVGLRNGQLVVHRELGRFGRRSKLARSYEIRWDIASVHATYQSGSRTLVRAGQTTPVLDKPAATKSGPGPSFVVEGQERWEGPADGSVALSASRTPSGLVELVISTTDDQRDATDRVELWWAPRNEDNSDPFGDKNTARGIQIAVDSAGRLQSGWLTIADGPAPIVSGSLAKAVLKLPADLAPSTPGDRWSVPLTAVYVDTDGLDAPSKIATSDLRPQHPGTFGLLYRLPNGARYPVIGAPVPGEHPWATLPKPDSR